MTGRAGEAMAAAEKSGARGAWIEELGGGMVRLVWVRLAADGSVVVCARLRGREDRIYAVVLEWGMRGEGRFLAENETAVRYALGLRGRSRVGRWWGR